MDTTNTIELLEAIGSDASLRYAQADELEAALERAQASTELRAAVATGDSAPLRDEFGIQETTQSVQTNAPGHGDEDDDEDDGDIPSPERRQPDRTPQPNDRDSLR